MYITIASPHVIPVTKYGGAQRVIWGLGKMLVSMGHRVTFLCQMGSTCDFADIQTLSMLKPLQEQLPSNCDVVLTQGNLPGLLELDTPYIHRVGGNGKPGERFPVNTFFMSHDHARRHGSEVFVYNGLDWGGYSLPSLNKSGKRLHFLAKVAWDVKNIKGAVNIIRHLPSHRLDVMGGSRVSFKMGFRACWSTQAKFWGMVGGLKKDRLMDKSRGLLFPVRWHEPIGNAILESLYFGCPVFGTPYGSLPELITAEYGHLSSSAEELAEAISTLDRYSPEQCHEYAKNSFSAQVMTERYLGLMRRVIAGEALNPNEPIGPADPGRNLPWRD